MSRGTALSGLHRKERWLSFAALLAGIVETDETFALESRKGERNLNRRPRWRRSASSRERHPLRRRAGARGRAHPDGQQSPQPDQGLPAAFLRHRYQASRQLSEAVPSRRARQASIAKSLPRSRQRQDMPAIRD